MVELLSFFVLLTAGLIFSEIFRRLHLPYVNALIIAGIIIGPYFLDLIEVDSSIEFVGAVGLIFLMFIAGSEIKMESFKKIKKDVFSLSILNGIIPFIVGFSIGQLFLYDFYTSLVLGVIFISSSIAVIIPSLESNRLLDTRIGKTIVSATVIEDVTSLLLLALVLQKFTQKTPLPLPIYIPTIIVLIVVLKMIIPKIEKRYYRNKRGRDLFESELRFIFTVLMATVVLFELLGMHAIVAGFIIGILLSDTITGKIEEKIKTISYGVFIPVFFIILGLQTDISVFLAPTSLILLAVIVTGLISSKIASGWLGGRLLKFSNKESFLIGVSTIPQLSTTLAAAFVALEFGLLGPELIPVLVVLSIITTFIAPLIIRMMFTTKQMSVHELKEA